MLNRYLTYYKPGVQFVVFCVILSMSWTLGGFIIEYINTKWTGISSAEIDHLKEISVSLANTLKIINAVLLALVLFLPAVLFAYLAYPEPLKYLGVQSPPNKQHWILAAALILIALPFTGLLEDWSKLIPVIAHSNELDDRYNKLATAMLKGNTINDLLLNITFMCLAPALIEEIFFRACLQRLLMAWMPRKPLWVIGIVAIVFSAFHGELSGFIPRVYLGLLLGLAYYYSGSIWVTILMHFINNFVSIFLSYLFQTHVIATNPTHMSATNIWLGLGSGILVCLFVYLFYKTRTPYQTIAVEKDEPPLQNITS